MSEKENSVQHENNENNENNNNEGFKEVRYRQRQQQQHPPHPRPNRQDVLAKVAAGDIKPEDADRMLRSKLPPRFVVTRTGAIALYNLQKNPIVLYADQWDKLSSLIKRGILDNYMEKNTNIIKRRYQPNHSSYSNSKEEQPQVTNGN